MKQICSLIFNRAGIELVLLLFSENQSALFGPAYASEFEFDNAESGPLIISDYA